MKKLLTVFVLGMSLIPAMSFAETSEVTIVIHDKDGSAIDPTIPYEVALKHLPRSVAMIKGILEIPTNLDEGPQYRKGLKALLSSLDGCKNVKLPEDDKKGSYSGQFKVDAYADGHVTVTIQFPQFDDKSSTFVPAKARRVVEPHPDTAEFPNSVILAPYTIQANENANACIKLSKQQPQLSDNTRKIGPPQTTRSNASVAVPSTGLSTSDAIQNSTE